MQETSEAIDQLDLATASDRGTVATLTTTNAKLVNKLEVAHAFMDNSRVRLRHSRTRLNLHGRDSDRQEQQTTTLIVGLMDTK
jgi:hypothetical protein